jgi:BA14K-like protein
MPFIVYLAILIATVFSVGLEWDALVEPSAATRHEIRAVTELGSPPRQAAPAAGTAAAPAVQPAVPAAAPAASAAVQPPAAAQTPPPQCDIDACTAAYHSFRASDCTYQPNEGPRRLCTKGARAVIDAEAQARTEGLAAHCHIRSCAEAYSSFNPGDCTYQPLEGPRRRCLK